MNKPMDIAMAEIRPSEHNTHLKSKKGDPAFDGLVASMEKIGLVQRITVREAKGGYEIVDGHRRWEAAKALKWKTIPADVTDADDDAANVQTLAANVQRLDNDPLAEAALVAEMRRRGMTEEAIAAAIGKSRSYVARRGRLATLADEWRDYAREMEITAATLERIAAYEPELQRRVWAETAERDGGKPDFRDEDEILTAFYNRLMTLDDHCPFAAKGCNGCPNNTASQSYLFADMQDEADEKPRCQCRECFVKKWNEAIAKKVARLRKDETIKVKTVKDRWGIPCPYMATEKREKTSAVAYLTEEELPRIWYMPKPPEDEAAPEKTPEERDREKRSKAWRKARQSAYAKIGRLVEDDADEVLKVAKFKLGYLEWSEKVCRRAIAETWNGNRMQEVYRLLEVETLHDLGCEELTPEEVRALNSEDPAKEAETGTDDEADAAGEED